MGRPGPVHVSLPSDVLEANFSGSCPEASGFAAEPQPLAPAAAQAIVQELANAQRPLVIAPPLLATPRDESWSTGWRQTWLCRWGDGESARHRRDPGLGAIATYLPNADTDRLLGRSAAFHFALGKAPAPWQRSAAGGSRSSLMIAGTRGTKHKGALEPVGHRRCPKRGETL